MPRTATFDPHSTTEKPTRVPNDSNDTLRRRLRELMPMQRKRHTEAMARIAAETASLNGRLAALQAELADTKARLDAVSDRALGAAPASSAGHSAIVAIDTRAAQEVCLFVTHAPSPTIKPYVVEHVRQLAANGIAVVLLINTSHAAERFDLPAELRDAVRGCVIRENVGFDFGAWAHGFALLPPGYRRLYLINDSIVGPLDHAAYAALLARVRGSNADLVGLTENSMPEPHLQSYFLALSERLASSETFKRLMSTVVNMPTKASVIVHYETQLTRFLRAQGFSSEALFRRLTASPGNPLLSNDTIHHWAELIELGFPFVKGEVLRTLTPSAQRAQSIPQRFFASADRAS